MRRRWSSRYSLHVGNWWLVYGYGFSVAVFLPFFHFVLGLPLWVSIVVSVLLLPVTFTRGVILLIVPMLLYFAFVSPIYDSLRRALIRRRIRRRLQAQEHPVAPSQDIARVNHKDG